MRHRPRKTDRLLEMIRGLALKQQKDAPQIFLSLRKAAQRFGVPVSAMAAIYKQLTEEGVLSGIRASRTMLGGRGALRNLKVRGLIGMPVSVSRFQTLLDYQRCFTRIRDELQAHGFLTSVIFFEQPEGKLDVIIEQLRKEKVDAVIWLLPDGADRETVLQLHDLGIHFVGVNITPLSGMACRYEVQRQRAIRAILRDWRADPEIKGVTIVRVNRDTAADAQRATKLLALVRLEKLKGEIAKVRGGHISTFLRSLCASKATGVILPAPAAAMLGWRASETVTGVLSMCRVALIDGPLYLPYAESEPLTKVDLVTVNWPPVAKRIAEDVVSGAAFSDSERVTFEAQPHLRVHLSDFA